MNSNPNPLRAVLSAAAAVILASVMAAKAQPGDALYIDGTAGRCVTATIPPLSSNYTFTAWVYLLAGGDFTTSRVGVLSALNCGDSAEVTVQNQSYAGLFGQYLMLGRCGAFNGASSGSQVPLNQWVNLAVTVDSALDVSYYINGAAAGGYSACVGSNLTIGPNITLGDNNQRMYNGMLDEVQIWKWVLSQAEIQAGMAQSPNVADTNLVAYWSFDEGSGTTATNRAMTTGCACDGTLMNSPAWVPSTVPFAPQITGAAPTAGGQFHLQFTGPAAASYSVLCATNPSLPLASWTSLGAASTVSSGLYQFTDPTAVTNQPQCFYMLQQQ